MEKNSFNKKINKKIYIWGNATSEIVYKYCTYIIVNN